MKTIIGIDIGGSTTKIVGYNDGEIINPMLVKADDPLASLYGAFGKFLNVNGMEIKDVDRVMITGVGASYVNSRLFGIPTGKVDEFRAIGMGGVKLTGLEKAVIVSMGTGTAFVKVEGGQAYHLGGSGIGGGTLLGLSNRMLNVRNFDDVIEASKGGDLTHVDLSIGDITKQEISGLTSETTASNFGRISDLADRSDIALGILNMVFQTIGSISVFAARSAGTRDVVLTGTLLNAPHCVKVFDIFSTLYDMNFHLPAHAEFATSVGCVTVYLRGGEFKELGA